MGERVGRRGQRQRQNEGKAEALAAQQWLQQMQRDSGQSEWQAWLALVQVRGAGVQGWD